MNQKIPAGFKQTEVGIIPEDWEVKTLNDLFQFQGGSQPPKSTFIFQHKEGYIRLLQIRDYKGDTFESYIPLNLAKRFCDENDIMIGRYGPPIFQILNGLNGAYNVALMKAIPTEIISKKYAWFTLKQEKLFQFVEKLSQRSSGQTGVDLVELKKYQIPFPTTKTEQTAIATALSDVDALINALDKLIAKKRLIKQGAMQELLTGKKRLAGFSGEWEEKTLETIADVIDPHPSHRAPPIDNNGIPFVGIGDLNEFGQLINDNVRLVSKSIYAEHLQRYNLKDDLIGLGRVASIGKVINLKNMLEKYTISPTLGVIKSINADRNYLFNILKSDAIKNQFRSIMSGSTRSSVGMVVLRKLLIPLPPTIEEQTAIAQILSDMDNEIAALEKRRAKTVGLKQGMMQELLTGKTRLIQHA